MDELACAKNQTKKEGQMKIKVNRGLDRKKVSFLPHFVAFLFKQLLVEVVGAWGLIEARIVSTFLILTSYYTKNKNLGYHSSAITARCARSNRTKT